MKESKFDFLVKNGMVIMGPADPEAQDTKSPQGISQGQKKYVEGLFDLENPASGAQAISMYMNSEDASRHGKPMSEGNVVLFERGGTIRASAFPDNMFSCVMAAKINTAGLTKDGLRQRLDAHLRNGCSIGSDLPIDVKGVISRDGSTGGAGDRKKWDCEMSPGSWSGVRYKKLDRGKNEFWLVTHCKNASVSNFFHNWTKAAAEKDGGRLGVMELCETPAVKRMENLARRNCARVMYKTAKAMGVSIASETDALSHIGDQREKRPKMATPQVCNVYNTLSTADWKGKKMALLLNKTTSLEGAEGLIVMTHPLKPIALYRFSGGGDAGGGKRLSESRVFKTAPVCMGREVAKDSDAARRLLEPRRSHKNAYAEKCYFWNGKHEGAQMPLSLRDNSFRELSATRREHLSNVHCVPPAADELHPCAVFVKV